MNFKDVVVSINGNSILATSADLQISFPYEEIESLGSQGTPFSSDQRENGTFSVSYYLQQSDSAIRSLIADGNPITKVDCTIGTLKIEDALLTSYSLSIKPFSLIEVSAAFKFFTHVVGVSSATITADPDTAIINGADTSISYASNFNNRFLSCDLNIAQDFQPVYTIGDSEPSSYSRINGEISLKIEGDDLPTIVSWPCSNGQSVDISLKSICDDLETLSYSDMIVKNTSASVQVGGSVVGAVEMYKLF